MDNTLRTKAKMKLTASDFVMLLRRWVSNRSVEFWLLIVECKVKMIRAYTRMQSENGTNVNQDDAPRLQEHNMPSILCPLFQECKAKNCRAHIRREISHVNFRRDRLFPSSRMCLACLAMTEYSVSTCVNHIQPYSKHSWIYSTYRNGDPWTSLPPGSVPRSFPPPATEETAVVEIMLQLIDMYSYRMV